LWVILECIKVGKWNGEGTITVWDINNIQCKRELEAHVRNSKSESRCKVTSWHCTGPGVQFTSYTSADILIETGGYTCPFPSLVCSPCLQRVHIQDEGNKYENCWSSVRA
jgi:hypothetical protein